MFRHAVQTGKHGKKHENMTTSILYLKNIYIDIRCYIRRMLRVRYVAPKMEIVVAGHVDPEGITINSISMI